MAWPMRRAAPKALALQCQQLCTRRPVDLVQNRDPKYIKLVNLKKLLDTGVITQAEFDREKAKILSQPWKALRAASNFSASFANRSAVASISAASSEPACRSCAERLWWRANCASAVAGR